MTATQVEAASNFWPEEKILEVHHLKKYFPVRRGWFSQARTYVRAVDDVSFSVRRGETFGLVGESGCGKTTLGRCILRLVEPTAGSIVFDGRDILSLDAQAMRALRRQMQIIFQDPFDSLDPRMSVEEIIVEPLVIHRVGSPSERRQRVRYLIDVVGLSSRHLQRYPHELSGGQRQRIGIARALALNPKFIVADEPVSALDVSIQSQILNLLDDLQEEFGLTYLFIAHGLNVVRHISDQLGVMYLGVLVELANTEEIYCRPLHPYTQALFASIPVPDPAVRRERIILRGDVPNPVEPPRGCRFHTRCPLAEAVCREVEPSLREVSPRHWVACHLS